MKKDSIHVRKRQKLAKSCCRSTFSQRNKNMQNVPLWSGELSTFVFKSGEKIWESYHCILILETCRIGIEAVGETAFVTITSLLARDSERLCMAARSSLSDLIYSTQQRFHHCAKKSRLLVVLLLKCQEFSMRATPKIPKGSVIQLTFLLSDHLI